MDALDVLGKVLSRVNNGYATETRLKLRHYIEVT